MADRFEVRVSPMERAIEPSERFALVIADPPWVPRARTGHHPEDPVLAIDGGADGLDVARSCLDVADRHLVPSGSLVLQLGTAEQAEALDEALPQRLRRRGLRPEERGVLVHCVADLPA